MSNRVVVGLQWGDEAKGKIVDYLARDSDLVIRYNGGNNAGHTVVINDEIYKFHIVPAGVLNPHITCVITDGVVIDPQVLAQELQGLQERGISTDRLKISGSAHVILPYHRMLDKLEETLKADKKIGTTGRGIGPAYADKMSRIGIRVSELVDGDMEKRLSELVTYKNRYLTGVFAQEPLTAAEIIDEYRGYAKIIAPYVTDTANFVYESARSGKRLLFEGAHGSLLDIDHGTYPYVTSSHTIAGGACIGTGVGPTMINEVVGVAKAYTTRVGEGLFPTELNNEIGEHIRERGNEYGTTTGRPRRCGWFDSVAVRRSVRISGVDKVALMLMDVLTGMPELHICHAYQCGPRKLTELPGDYDTLAKCEPIYERIDTWSEDISEAKQISDLPPAARSYVKRIEELIEVPIGVISVGRRRDQTIVL